MIRSHLHIMRGIYDKIKIKIYETVIRNLSYIPLIICRWDLPRRNFFYKCVLGAVCSVILLLLVLLQNLLQSQKKSSIPRKPSAFRDLCRNVNMHRILTGSSSSSCCQEYLRMRRGPFLNLASIMRDRGFLQDTIHVPIIWRAIGYVPSRCGTQIKESGDGSRFH